MLNSKQSGNTRSKPKTREAIRSVSVVDRLVSALGRNIAGGVWKPEETLPTEPEMAHRFGAGRNAVREAVKILAAKGFVRTERRAGTIVRPEFCWNLLDPEVLNWMLIGLGEQRQSAGRIVRTALHHRTYGRRPRSDPCVSHGNATNLRDVRSDGENSATRSKSVIDVDVAFHELLFEATHNRLLIALVPAFSLLSRTNFEISIRAGKPASRNLKEHRQIVEAVSRRDPNGARRASRKLLAKNAADLAERIKRERRTRK